MRGSDRLPDGRLAELPPYFEAMAERGERCPRCHIGVMELETSKVPERVMGSCPACGWVQGYSCPPGMAHVRPRAARPAAPPGGGEVLGFRPLGA